MRAEFAIGAAAIEGRPLAPARSARVACNPALRDACNGASAARSCGAAGEGNTASTAAAAAARAPASRRHGARTAKSDASDLARQGVDRVGASRPWGSNSGLGGTPGRSRITSSPSAPPALPPPPAVVSAPLGDAAHTKHVQFRHASNTLEFGSVGARGPSKPRERPSCIIFACTR